MSKYLDDAAKLAAAMKDVPREAWPSGLRFDWNLHGPKREKHWFDSESRIADSTVELACIGSMVAWLVAQNNEDPESSVKLLWDGEHFAADCNDQNWYHAPTLVEALAAACKSIGERP